MEYMTEQIIRAWRELVNWPSNGRHRNRRRRCVECGMLTRSTPPVCAKCKKSIGR